MEKRTLKLIAIVVLLTLPFSRLYSQDSKTEFPDIRISGYLNYKTLDRTLDSLSSQYGLDIRYDPAYCRSVTFNYYFGDATVERVLKKATSRKEGMKFFIRKDKVIFVLAPGAKITQKEAEVQLERYQGEASAYDFTLNGIVREEGTGEALPYANIRIAGSSIGTTSNVDGYFTLQKVPSDTSVVHISYLGFRTLCYQLTPETPKNELELTLIPEDRILDEVMITEEREQLLKTNEKLSMIRISPRKLKNLPNLGEKDVMRSFQLMPGVSAANESSSGLYVRGGTPDQNLILYDGFTVYQVDHLYGFYSAFNSNAIKDVRLYKGGFEAMYGGRISAVTEITAKDGNANKWNLGGDLSLLGVNVYAEIPIGDKFTSLMAYRRSFKGPLYNSIFEQFNDGEDTPTAPGGRGGRFANTENNTVTNYFYDLNGKFTYRPSDRDIVSLSIFNGTDKLDNGVSIDTPPFLADLGVNLDFEINDLTRYGNVGSSFKWSRRWNRKWYSNTLVGYSNYYSERDRSREGTVIRNGEETEFRGGIFEENDLKDINFKSDHTWKWSASNELSFGAFGNLFDIDYTFAQNDTSTILDRSDRGTLAGVYVQNSWKGFKGKLEVVPGVRLSHFSETDQAYAEPRLNVNLQLAKGLKLSGAWGKYYQFANRVIREDILSGSRDFWVLSDGNQIPVSSAEHYILGLSYEKKSFLASVEAYYKDLDGITEYSLRFEPRPGNVDYEENFFNGIGYARGLEFLVQKQYGKFNGWVSYTLAEARNQFDVYGFDYFPAAQDVTHEFKAVGLYNWRKWNFSATWVYATGRPYTAPEGGYTVDLLDGTTQDFITSGVKNGTRLPDYHRLDLAANYELRNEEGKQFGSLGFSLFNLYGRRNVWYKQYEVVEGQVIETNQLFLGFTPNVSLSLQIR